MAEYEIILTKSLNLQRVTKINNKQTVRKTNFSEERNYVVT